MAGLRIRTLKPEWLEDEQLLRAGSHARVLSVALILLADDYGRGRCIPEALAAQVFPFDRESSRLLRESLAKLFAMGFVGVYRVRDQHYFEIRHWARHQRVDKPGKPRVPSPNPNDFLTLELSGDFRESFQVESRELRESLVPDRDLDQDLDQEGECACAIPRAVHGGTGGGGGRGPSNPEHTPFSHEASQNLTAPANGLGSSSEGDGNAPLELADRLWAIWAEHCDSDASRTLTKTQRELLAQAASKLLARSPDAPEARWANMIAAYAAQRRAAKLPLDLRFFVVEDFDKWAEFAGRAQNGSNGAAAKLPMYEPFPPHPGPTQVFNPRVPK